MLMAASSAPNVSIGARQHATIDQGDAGVAATPHVLLEQLTKRFHPRRSLSEIARLHRRRLPVTVVDHVSLTVARGEIFGLLGPNGAGKTTIFKMLSTLIIPDGGAAHVAGADVVRAPQQVRRVLSSVPADERSLNWRLDARENLRLYAALHRVPRREVEPLIDTLLAAVELSGTDGKLVAAFSTGMRQRLLIARALVSQPAILLLDEPTRGLDPLSAESLRTFIREELVGRRGCTVLLATHDTSEAFGLCDRVGVLHRGRLLATGAAGALAVRFGIERVRVVTRDPAHPAWTVLERVGLLERLTVGERASDGWWNVECSVSGAPDRCALVLKELVEQGVSVARLERIEATLAELITGIIASLEDPAGA